MQKRNLLFSLALLLAAGCVTPGGGLTENAVIRAKNKVAPALVHIRPVKEVFEGGKREEVPIVGSGFLITPDGYVVTNEHVIGDSQSVKCVLFNKDEVEAEVVGVDPETDVGVLKLKTVEKDLPTVKLGESGSLESGQMVLAMGSPHGLARSVSLGIISQTDRFLGNRDELDSPYMTWIQTDAAINPGNSGGPLVNLSGEVVGINARKLYAAENVGFAIPIDIAKEVIAQIRENGRVIRSWIGVNFQEMTQKTSDPTQHGVIIADIDPLSPAAEAGLQPGDILLSMNGIATHARFVEDLPAIQKLIADQPVGSQLTLLVMRGGQVAEAPVQTTEKEQRRGKEIELSEWGFTVSQITAAIIRLANIPSSKGVLVSGTQVGGIAFNAGLERGDIILSMDGEEIADLAAFEAIYRTVIAEQKKLVLLDVRQGALTRYVLVKNEPQSIRQPNKGGQPNGN